MNHFHPDIFLQSLHDKTQRHLVRVERRRLAEARQKAARDRRQLDRAWAALSAALEAEARSRRELADLSV